MNGHPYKGINQERKVTEKIFGTMAPHLYQIGPKV